ncbi:hypothetical protein MK851_05780 [Tenacibaculum sp. 1B UA]|uniref:DUF6624 domain-containing protein n=1 Tax=Tenacibaculum sp. 1B UA TaxID=2922252 RepID=UPI002A24007F|nr:DUF6624 domain-containing protein [Tenacibaculum sp. 1B UA]MDX8553136.1 hypothetical protein [Tenacibaculum sp. 1B UA]
MRIKVFTVLVLILLFGCKTKNENPVKKGYDQELVDELVRMVEMDQVAAGIPSGKHKQLTKEEWKSFKDSVFSVTYKNASEIFKEHGFVGFDVVGEDGSRNFWLIVQHLDSKPEFQKTVLKKMKIEVENKNANPENYAYLLDRVKLNMGEKQVYGTQVLYNWNVCQAYSKPLIDSINVNKRRNKIGMKPLEVYLNEMSKMHFEINSEVFSKISITEPKLYKVED